VSQLSDFSVEPLTLLCTLTSHVLGSVIFEPNSTQQHRENSVECLCLFSYLHVSEKLLG